MSDILAVFVLALFVASVLVVGAIEGPNDRRPSTPTDRADERSPLLRPSPPFLDDIRRRQMATVSPPPEGWDMV